METLNRLPWAAKDSVFSRLAEIGDVSSLTKEERMKYDEGLRKYRDTLCVMDGAREEGWEKGQKEGREAGLKEAWTSTVHNLRRMGMSVDFIMQATGLPAEEIEKI